MASDIIAQALAGNIQLTQQFGSAFETGMKIAQAAEAAKMDNAIKEQQLELSRQRNAAESQKWGIDAIRTGIKDVPVTKRKAYFEQIKPHLEQLMGANLGPGFTEAMGLNPEMMSSALTALTKAIDDAGGDMKLLMQKSPEIAQLATQALGSENPKDGLTMSGQLLSALSRANQGRGLESQYQAQQNAIYQAAVNEADKLGVPIPKSLFVPPTGAGLSPGQLSDLATLRENVNSAKNMEMLKPRIQEALDVSEKVKANKVQSDFLKGYMDGSIPRNPETTGRAGRIASEIIAANKRQEFVISERDKTLGRSDVIYNNIAKINEKFGESKGQLDTLTGLLADARAGNAVAGNMLYGPLQSLSEGRNSIVRDPELARVMNSQGIISSIAQILPKLASGEPASPEILDQVEGIRNTLAKAMSRGYKSQVKPILTRAKQSGISENTLISDDMKDLYKSGDVTIKKSKEPKLPANIESNLKRIMSNNKDKAVRKRLLDQYNKETKGPKIPPLKMKELIGE